MKLINGLNHHFIDEHGKVINRKTGTVLKLRINKNGYYYFTATEFNKATTISLHRAIAIAFIKNPESKRTVNHIDGNKLNNSLSNLEWSTDSENIQHAYNTGLNKSNSKVTKTHLKKIYKRFFEGENLTVISKDFPYNNVTVSNHMTKYIQLLGEEKKYEAQKRKNRFERASASKIKRRQKISLKMIDINTKETLKIFTCLAEAKIYLNKKSSGPISNVLNNRQKTAYGYLWSKQ